MANFGTEVGSISIGVRINLNDTKAQLAQVRNSIGNTARQSHTMLVKQIRGINAILRPVTAVAKAYATAFTGFIGKALHALYQMPTGAGKAWKKTFDVFKARINTEMARIAQIFLKSKIFGKLPMEWMDKLTNFLKNIGPGQVRTFIKGFEHAMALLAVSRGFRMVTGFLQGASQLRSMGGGKGASAVSSELQNVSKWQRAEAGIATSGAIASNKSAWSGNIKSLGNAIQVAGKSFILTARSMGIAIKSSTQMAISIAALRWPIKTSIGSMGSFGRSFGTFVEKLNIYRRLLMQGGLFNRIDVDNVRGANKIQRMVMWRNMRQAGNTNVPYAGPLILSMVALKVAMDNLKEISEGLGMAWRDMPSGIKDFLTAIANFGRILGAFASSFGKLWSGLIDLMKDFFTNPMKYLTAGIKGQGFFGEGAKAEGFQSMINILQPFKDYVDEFDRYIAEGRTEGLKSTEDIKKEYLNSMDQSPSSFVGQYVGFSDAVQKAQSIQSEQNEYLKEIADAAKSTKTHTQIMADAFNKGAGR